MRGILQCSLDHSRQLAAKLLDNVCVLDENYKVVMPDLSEDVILDGPVENGFLLLGVNKPRLL
jgi:hypothetical protein